MPVRYVPTSQIHVRVARAKVMNSTEPRTRLKTPIQKREEAAAVKRARVSVPRTKEAKRRTGTREKSIWATMKDYRIRGGSALALTHICVYWNNNRLGGIDWERR